MAAYWEIAALSAYDMFSKYLIINLVFPHLGFWSGGLRLFLIIAYLYLSCKIRLGLDKGVQRSLKSVDDGDDNGRTLGACLSCKRKCELLGQMSKNICEVTVYQEAFRPA